MILDYLELIYSGLRNRKLRSWLTMLGIFIGIAAVVSLVSLGQGLQGTINDMFQKLGTNKVMVYAGGNAMESAFVDLSDHDLAVIKQVKGVSDASGMYYKPMRIKFNKKTISTMIIGWPTDESRRLMEQFQTVNLLSGRFLKQGDNYKAMIGYNLANKDTYFGRELNLRSTFELEGKEFKVVAILDKIGNEGDDTQVYVPLDTLRAAAGKPEALSFILVEVQQGFLPADVAEAITKAMRKDRNLKEGEENFRAQTFENLLSTLNTVFLAVQAVVIGIAAISLLVGGIGIMNTMYTAVLERTKEIGIMKAIGATNQSIMTIFLLESGILGLAGGAVGAALGAGIAALASSVGRQLLGTTYLQAVFPLYLILGALAFSFVVGIISGVLPAMQASRLRPVEALRYE
jgi:putative ABC transport system permease protein